MAALAAAAILLWQMRLPLLQRFTPAPALLSDAPAQAIELPRAVPERLWADLEGLSFKRYREAERAQARLYIQQRLEVAGWQTQLQPFAGGVNLVAERQGSDPSLGAILLGAHYDTVEVAPGADDNATAVAALLEAARLLKPPTPRTLQLVFFDLEERGLLGSKPFVEQLSPKSVQAAVVLDMIGYRCDQPGCQSYPPLLPMQSPPDRGDFLAVLGDQSHADLLKYFTAGTASGNASGNASGAQVLPPVITLAIPTLGGLAPDLVRSDHAPFWNKGIGAVLVSDTANFRNPNYHQASDTLETIDPDFFVGSAQIVINAVAQMLQN
ncbi:MAG: M20/M25/M40 family metallo-hydrolase [Pegethrix bostrychoides GSE-TBD4-15B]|jgi:hypothetical protein|uniref:M20/M25/M40 family metallo-hydrolase n=1 Tax=Pegethrix bostrychoides GSE-TBD4-15B TaxID=2839662 RepID=A0A951P913_9CYAN|nr:M20/M25/M40 family metallo-hydrolase [Pegethrix bostrychoides GSE-TBD4-15B]